MPKVHVRRVLLLAAFSLVPVAAQKGDQTLELGKAVERELAADQTHTYTLTLAANQVARVVAEQRGVDLVLSVFAPDGSRLFDVDSPNGTSGEERATIATRQAGEYRVEVRSFTPTAGTGRYAIRLDQFVSEIDYLTERLAGLGRVWGAVKFFHPSLAYKTIDWDEALIKAIPAVKAARTPGEYRAAINTMLEALGDPATTAELPVIEGGSSAAAPDRTQEPTYYRVVDGFVVVSAIDWAKAFMSGSSAALAKQPEMLAAITKATGVVVDCRYADISFATVPSFFLEFYLDNLLPSLVQGSVPLGTERYRLHNGYAPQRGGSSGAYESFFATRTPAVIVGQAKDRKALAVVIDDRTPNLFPVLSGLQATGAKIVQVGGTTSKAGARPRRMLLSNGVRVDLRVAEVVPPGGGSVFQPDVRLTKGDGGGEGAIIAAIAALKSPSSNKAQVTAPPIATAILQGQKDSPYAQMSSPAEEYRLLALFRFWNVIHYFYPYKGLTDRPWDTVLTDFIPRFLKNQSALEYQTTVAEMVARMQDSHGSVTGLQALNEHLGTFAPPFRLASAGGQLAVVDLVDATATQSAGVRLGDVIQMIDGELVAKRLARLGQLRSLSTSQAGYASVYPAALRGAKDTVVKLRVDGADGQTRDVELPRSVPLSSVSGMLPRKTPIYHVLPHGYGYIDLARLTLADVEKAMNAVMQTPALIFDMRGYPNGTAWAIAPRLTDRKNVIAALFRRPLQAATNFDDDDRAGRPPDYAFEQTLPPGSGAVYKGQVVMLINEFAISQSEHTCLFLESATNVTFIGSPTNGANGDVTNLVLPGGIYVNFSGHDVRHADGRQLQRVGIQPHIRVEPTPRGISARRDEVLEAAVRHLDQTVKR